MIFLEVWWIFAIFYGVFFWGIPMLGMLSNRWVNEAEGTERSRRYWMGVRWASSSFHIAAVLAGIILYFLNPYLFPA